MRTLIATNTYINKKVNLEVKTRNGKERENNKKQIEELKIIKLNERTIRRKWNKDNRQMTVQAVGNLKVPIGTENKNNDLKGTKKIRDLDWSANEDGIDERIGKSKSLMYPR